MAPPVAGIDPHRDSFTVGVVDPTGQDPDVSTSFANSGEGYAAAVEYLIVHGVERVGIEGSATWGSHIAVVVTAAGFDAREVPPQRAAAQRRARRHSKTDALDAAAIARAVILEPTLGPIQALEAIDPLLAELEAVLEHRRLLVARRTLTLNHLADQLAKLPAEIRDQIGMTGKIESRLRRLDAVEHTDLDLTAAACYRLSWLAHYVDSDRADVRELARLGRRIEHLLEQHGTTLRDEHGIGPIAAATLLCEIGDPSRFATEGKFARWCGTAAVAVSSGEGDNAPVRHRLDTGGNRRVNSILHIASVTQQRDRLDAATYLTRKLSEGKTTREARRAHKRHLANRVIRRMWHDQRRTLADTTEQPAA